MNAQPPPSRALDSRFSLLPLLIAPIIAGLLLHVLFGRGQTEFDQAALGPETVQVCGMCGDSPIHAVNSAGLEKVLNGLDARGARSAGLWLGNSQLHGVNQYKPGQQSAPKILFDQLQPSGLEVVAVSPPNSSLQELYLLFEYFRSRRLPRLVIVGLCCDDLREDGVRDNLSRMLNEPAVQKRLTDTSIGQRLLVLAQPGTGDADLKGVANTVQEKSERFLNEWLDTHMGLWRARREARGSIFLGLYRLRNTVLRINPQTKRKMIPACRKNNLEAFAAMAQATADCGAKFVAYIVPIRQDLEVPYVPQEYRRFKQDVEAIVKRTGGTYMDLETLVPPEFWGKKDSTSVSGQAEVDFFHFQAQGHRLLAEAILPPCTAGARP